MPLQESRHLLQKQQAGKVGIHGTVIRKVLTDIAQSRRSEQRIDHGMQQGISIGMTGQPFFVRNPDAAQNERSAIRPRMHVVSETHSQKPFSSRIFSRIFKSICRVIFKLNGSPSTTRTRPPKNSTIAASSVKVWWVASARAK